MADDSIRADDEGMPRRRRRLVNEEDEGEDEERRVRSVRDDDGGLSVLIPYKNARALVSYYTGVFSLIPIVGLILGPVAVLLGILALTYVRKYPTAKGTAHAIVGIVLGVVTTLANYGCIAVGIIMALANAKK
jgi:hypothetical protein